MHTALATSTRATLASRGRSTSARTVGQRWSGMGRCCSSTLRRSKLLYDHPGLGTMVRNGSALGYGLFGSAVFSSVGL